MDWKRFNERVEALLRLNSSAVAVTMIEPGDPDPKGCGDPPQPLTLCQFITMARVHGAKLFATPDNVLCSIAQGMLGFDRLPDVAPRFAGGRTATVKAYNNILEDMPKVALGTYRGAAIVQLSQAEFEPDVILFVSDPARMTRLLHATTFHTGERIQMHTAAEAGTCGEALAGCLVSRKPTIGFPCYGSRSYGLIADDELIFALPAHLAESCLDGLEKTHARLNPYPIRKFLSPPPWPRVNFLLKELTPEGEAELKKMKKAAGHVIEDED